MIRAIVRSAVVVASLAGIASAQGFSEGTVSLSPGHRHVVYSPEAYRDFEASVEVKVTNASVGFLFHTVKSDAFAAHEKASLGVPGLYGQAVRISPKGLRVVANDGTKANVLVKKPEVKAGADWHALKVRSEDGKITVWLDGTEAAAVTDETFLEGGFALAASALKDATDAKVEYRKTTVKPLERTPDWVALFNGKNFDGWKQWGEEKWDIEDGTIIGRSGPKKSEGYLATEKTWSDFRVKGKFKMLGEGNFGLFFHSTITLRENDGYPVIAGVQGEVEPAVPSSTGWMYESYKRGWLVEPPKNTLAAYVLNPTGWNEIEIRSEGKVRTTWVNGVRALNFDDPEPLLTEGSFALQLHAGGVDGIAWKDLYVRK